MDAAEENKVFDLAAEVVMFTSCNLFLTGKAGTGKTTFLKFIRSECNKNTVVVAPTGVAAVNAGGVTMHSFLQLPFIPYLPNQSKIFGNSASVDRYELLKGIRLSKQKIEIIRNLDLLIIDEVSMLRADMLDALDTILRHVRNKPNHAYGGVQVLFIGDLFQLPPVVSDDEWELMKDYYKSPFFFHAKVIEENPPLFIELKKVYRQKEETFIHLLNHIRHNALNTEDMQLLNSRYRPADVSDMTDAITLTTHNYMADTINQRELQKLDGPLYNFEGEIHGDFSDKALPTEKTLLLKEGAQIMFLKNDPDPAKRYFNGKLAKVISIDQDEIRVMLADSDMVLTLQKEKWSNVKYVLNKENNKLEEEELGSFTQYPVRLAWAITIHKSQGLTFDKVIIDAGNSFAAGQVYVALSRCRSLEGIVLLSRIQASGIKSDDRIIAFSNQEQNFEEILNLLQTEKPKFAAQLLLKAFDWSILTGSFLQFESTTSEKQLPDKETIMAVVSELTERVKKQQETADKFMNQLSQILGEKPINGDLLQERVIKAKQYFVQLLSDELSKPLSQIKELLKGKTKVKQYLKLADAMEAEVWAKIEAVQSITYGDFNFDVTPVRRDITVLKKSAKNKAKGDSKLESLAMYKEGMSVQEIAAQRGLAESTIESHLASFIETEEVNALDFTTKEIIEMVERVISESENENLTHIRNITGESITYAQIRFALGHIRLIRKKAEIEQ